MMGRLTAFAKTLAYPGGWRFCLSDAPRSATSFRIASELHAVVGSLGTIIDGGANVGQFSRACSRFFPDARIIAFEPLPEIVRQLETNLSDLEQLVVIQSALGSEVGETTYHRASDSQCSSVLPINAKVDGMQGIRHEESLTVPMSTLDSRFPSNEETAKPILLKLDLQGYELEALRGATELLANTDYVLIEAGFDEAYLGEPAFDELWQFLHSHRFAFYRPLNLLTNRRGAITQIDALFHKIAA